MKCEFLSSTFPLRCVRMQDKKKVNWFMLKDQSMKTKVTKSGLDVFLDEVNLDLVRQGG